MEFKVGDRVMIIGRGHPWRGHAGTIREPFDAPSVPDLCWRVALDSGLADTAVAEREIRHAAD